MLIINALGLDCVSINASQFFMNLIILESIEIKRNTNNFNHSVSLRLSAASKRIMK